MRPVRIRRLARAEIGAAYRWYRAQSPQAAEGFESALDNALELIVEAPERAPILRGQLRRVRLRGFPHAVYYKAYPTVISVVGVIHGRRHPRTWLRRAEP